MQTFEKLYINIFLYGTLFPSYKKNNLSKISLLLNNKNIKTFFITRSSSEMISELDHSKMELISFKNSLKEILNYSSKIKRLEEKYKIKSIIYINLNKKFISNYHISLLYDTWEYLNFRGVPNKDIWIEIYDSLNELNKLNIKINLKFKEVNDENK